MTFREWVEEQERQRIIDLVCDAVERWWGEDCEDELDDILDRVYNPARSVADIDDDEEE